MRPGAAARRPLIIPPIRSLAVGGDFFDFLALNALNYPIDKMSDKGYHISVAKWDSMRKLKRNKELRQCAQRNPDWSLKEIAQVFGISRQRVWQILEVGIQCPDANNASVGKPSSSNS